MVSRRAKAALLLLLAASSNNTTVVDCLKIAFVGDTGIEDKEDNGYGPLTMQMIHDQGVDLVVDVGDYDYWGRCVQQFNVTETFEITSFGRNLVTVVPDNTVVKRFKWQDGRHQSVRGWEIGIQLDGRRQFTRLVIAPETWSTIYKNLKQTIKGPNCWGQPWDGPWLWNQFVRDYDFDFLGAAGNVEVKDEGSPAIWADHQRYMHELYLERIYNTNKGACHGYLNEEAPGSVDEYGERYSCYYGGGGRNNEDHHFIFLGWWQGSDEHWNDNSKEERRKSIDFIEREFSSERSQNVRWRYCIHHMTSAKLSSGDDERDSMKLSGITDACRKHGAIIVNGHHHLYSRTKMLQSVGGPEGDEPIVVADDNMVVSEGVTMSLTVGMGGYDGSCNGKYANSPWMQVCVASFADHRGAVIAEFDDQEPWKANFRYMNSIANGEVVDEFNLTSRLPGANRTVTTIPPTSSPSSDVHFELSPVAIIPPSPNPPFDVQSPLPTVSPGGAPGNDTPEARNATTVSPTSAAASMKYLQFSLVLAFILLHA